MWLSKSNYSTLTLDIANVQTLIGARFKSFSNSYRVSTALPIVFTLLIRRFVYCLAANIAVFISDDGRRPRMPLFVVFIKF